MMSKVKLMETTIPNGCTVSIQNGKGLDLTVLTGFLWVTYENDTKDFVLQPGHAFNVSRNGLTLIQAFQDVRLRIAYPAEAAAPGLTFGGGYREFGASVVRSMIAEWLRGIRGKFATAAIGNSDAKPIQAQA